MGKRETITLATVLLNPEDVPEGAAGLLYRVGDAGSCIFEAGSQGMADAVAAGAAPAAGADDDAAVCGCLRIAGAVDFTTYLNAFSSEKWARYTDVTDVRLVLEYAGDACAVQMRSYASDELPDALRLGESAVLPATDEFTAITLAVPKGGVIAGFAIQSCGETRIRNVRYETQVPESRLRRVELALCTTTFEKEAYITANVDRIRREVIESGDDIAQHFHMFVVDNGRTLDAEAVGGGGVTVCPNANVGGSGGFARGMLEALHSARDFTHVVLMDDDVRMCPESFKRLYALLRLTNERYADAFVAGAMLEMAQPTKLYEDVAELHKTGKYERIKHDFPVDELAFVIRNEMVDVERPHTYGAWWLNCIPVSAIREHGLPLPFFVRCDDVEFGIRCGGTYMTLNGIAVWHERFMTRFNAAVDAYQYLRNMFITMAVTGYGNEALLALRVRRELDIYLRTMNYCSADLLLDGLEAYLDGPEALLQADGAALMRANMQRNEKLTPLDELDPAIIGKLDIREEWLDGEDTRGVFLKLMETLPHDRHFLPDALLRDTPAMVAPGASFSPWQKTAARRHLVAVDSTATKGAIRTMDRERARAIRERHSALVQRFKREHAALEAQWRALYPQLTSEEYWMRKLGMDGAGATDAAAGAGAAAASAADGAAAAGAAAAASAAEDGE